MHATVSRPWACRAPWASHARVCLASSHARASRRRHRAREHRSAGAGHHAPRNAVSAHASGGGIPPPTDVATYDVLVLGSGIAGLTYALEAAKRGMRVAVVTKGSISEGSTRYAQGGVAAVLNPSTGTASQTSEGSPFPVDGADSVCAHVADTMSAGSYLNDEAAVATMCREGPRLVDDLVAMGVAFTRNAEDGSLHLGREGGHSHSRVVHAADMTGAAIEACLVDAVRAQPAIAVHEHTFALDLLSVPSGDFSDDVSKPPPSPTPPLCVGADAVCLQSGRAVRFVAKATVLATGGAGQVYPTTTNPEVATGDGIAMAYRTHASVANMEFVQFHPTALYMPNQSIQSMGDCYNTGPSSSLSPSPSSSPSPSPSPSSVFLITEAVRGAGGILLNLAGERFMPGVDPRAELAPRDVVARGIYEQMRTRGESHVLLDVSHISRHEILSHFPNIARHCKQALGLDITQDAIPVAPAQHYTCGGVQVRIFRGALLPPPPPPPPEYAPAYEREGLPLEVEGVPPREKSQAAKAMGGILARCWGADEILVIRKRRGPPPRKLSLQQTSDSSLILSLSLFLSPFSLSLSPLSPLSLSLFCRPVCAARQPSKGSTPSARSHTRACTAQIGWRATRSWKGLSLGAGLWRRASRM